MRRIKSAPDCLMVEGDGLKDIFYRERRNRTKNINGISRNLYVVSSVYFDCSTSAFFFPDNILKFPLSLISIITRKLLLSINPLNDMFPLII